MAPEIEPAVARRSRRCNARRLFLERYPPPRSEGSPLVSRDFARCHVPVDRRQRMGRLWLRVLVVWSPCGLDQITIAASIRAGRQLPVPQLAGVESDR